MDAEAELHGSFFRGMVPSSFRLMSGAEGVDGVLADSSTDGQTNSETENTFPRTTYTGGKKYRSNLIKQTFRLRKMGTPNVHHFEK